MRGRSLEAAAAIAARQGKGHIGELRQSAEFTLRAALMDEPYQARPNPVANDPQIDVEISTGRRTVGGAQVGVGSPRYLARKVRRSLAPQVVINKEARDLLVETSPDLGRLSTDRLWHRRVEASSLSGEQVEIEARQILESFLLGDRALSFSVKLAIAGTSGASSFITTAGVSLLYDVVDSIRSGTPVTADILDRAVRSGARAAARTSIQTWFLVDRFLAKAKSAYSARLLRAVGQTAIWAGALADVIVSTAVDLVAWFRNELTFDEFLTRVGVEVFSATGAAAGVTLALAVSNGTPWWFQVLLCGGLAWAGGTAGRRIGETLLSSPITPVAVSPWIRAAPRREDA
jgi:hypothetical protein